MGGVGWQEASVNRGLTTDYNMVGSFFSSNLTKQKYSNEEWSSQLWTQFMHMCKKPEKNSRLRWDLNPWPRDTGETL